MFNFFKKKEQKDPICGMVANASFISKYRQKFCSENCMRQYEVQNHIAGSDYDSAKGSGGCCG